MKKGFTLAEVLITLVIIGIVAALTISTMMNNKRNEEYQRTIRVIQEILKQCDPSTIAGFTAIENSIQYNSEKSNDTKNKNNNNNLPQIGNMLHFSSHHKKRFKEIIQVQMLKQQINFLNEELAKKNEEISQLKKMFIVMHIF